MPVIPGGTSANPGLSTGPDVIAYLNGTTFNGGQRISGQEILGANQTTTNPKNSGAMTFGVTAEYKAVPVGAELNLTSTFPDTNKLKDTVERSLRTITEKKGIANFAVFDKTAGTRKYKTVSFFAHDVAIDRAESVSIVKTNRGFTLYSPDHEPIMMVLTGSLLAGDDWPAEADPSIITQTDWFSKFLLDYERRLSATASLRTDTRVFFSFEDVFAEVFLTSLRTSRDSMSPSVSGFQAQMVVKDLRIIERPDISGSTADPGAVDDCPAASMGDTQIKPARDSELCEKLTKDGEAPPVYFHVPTSLTEGSTTMLRDAIDNQFNLAVPNQFYPLP